MLVPLVGNAASGRALHVACRLAGERGTRLVAVTVIEIPPLLPLDAHMREEEQEAHELLTQAELVADSYGVAVTSRALRAREAAPAILEQVEASGAEVVVIGAERRPRLKARAPVFGRTVQEVLKGARCRVIVVGRPTTMVGSRAPSGSQSSLRSQLSPPARRQPGSFSPSRAGAGRPSPRPAP